jgi:hypothetical protein
VSLTHIQQGPPHYHSCSTVNNEKKDNNIISKLGTGEAGLTFVYLIPTLASCQLIYFSAIYCVLVYPAKILISFHTPLKFIAFSYLAHNFTYDKYLHATAQEAMS